MQIRFRWLALWLLTIATSTVLVGPTNERVVIPTPYGFHTVRPGLLGAVDDSQRPAWIL